MVRSAHFPAFVGADRGDRSWRLRRRNPLPPRSFAPTRAALALTGAPVATVMTEALGIMSQRAVEILMGRLLTDEELRTRFLAQPFETLSEFSQKGYELSAGEIDALLHTDADLWTDGAERIPPRLQRCSLRCPRAQPTSTSGGQS